MRYTFVLGLALLFSGLSGQENLLQSGPMLGYVEMREVLLWVQTTKTATVRFEYWDREKPAVKHLTAEVATSPVNAHAVKLVADRVQPGITYDYQLLINGEVVERPYPTTFTTPPIWRWRTDPPDFSVGLGSCNYINEAAYDRPGKGYGGDYKIFGSILEQDPDLMIWLGDNTYLREPDWYTRTGILHRYTHTRSTPELQPLLANVHHYAIWDDHDYGPNNSDRTWVQKDLATEIFKLFWGNLTFGRPEFGGITGMFRYQDVDFFLLDNRSFRNPNEQRVVERRTILGTEQLEWLIESLVNSDATYKMVCIGGQVLSGHRGHENYINIAPEERAYLLRRIEEEGLEKVVFLTGDRHHSELSTLTLGNGRKLYDLTVSSLTAGTGRSRDEINPHRVPETLVVQNNFGVLSFSGPRKDRKLNVSIYATDGELLWERSLD